MGFDGIIGHHPHLVQPIVRRGPKWAAFSIGDFVGGDRTIVSRFSIALALHFFPDDVHLEVWPLVQSPYWAPAKTVLLEEAPPFEQLVWRHVFAPRVADAEGTP